MMDRRGFLARITAAIAALLAVPKLLQAAEPDRYEDWNDTPQLSGRALHRLNDSEYRRWIIRSRGEQIDAQMREQWRRTARSLSLKDVQITDHAIISAPRSRWALYGKEWR